MSEECVNDCREPLRFPRRPGATGAAGAADEPCGGRRGRLSPDNRPGLDHFNYRIGSYADIREFLLRRLDQSEALAGWTYRGADDPGIALVEGAAILGDILTFYQELYANEAFLRTARWRESLADLVRLTGYRLAPGVGGRATFAVQVKGDGKLTVPAGFPLKAPLEGQAKPADFETAESVDAYPWLSKFALYRPLADNVTITTGTAEFRVASPNPYAQPFPLKAGDRLLAGSLVADGAGGRLDNPEILIVDRVRSLHGVQHFTIKGRLKTAPGGAQLQAYLLGRSFHHFGHNGPPTLVKTPNPVTSTATQKGDTTTVTSDLREITLDFSRKLQGATQRFPQTLGGSAGTAKREVAVQWVQWMHSGSPIEYSMAGETQIEVEEASLQSRVIAEARIVSPSLADTEFPLDAEVRDLPNGAALIVQGRFSKSGQSREFAVIRSLASSRSTAVTWGQLTATTSLATLNAALSGSSLGYDSADIRELLLYEVLSPLLTLNASFTEAGALTGNVLNFFGTHAEASTLLGRSLLLDVPGAEPVLAAVSAVAPAPAAAPEVPQLHGVTLSQEVAYPDFPNEQPTASVYGNLVAATQGKTESRAVLGSGDERLAFQTFALPKLPLTYLLSTADTPPEAPELSVYVNGRLWRRVASLFGRKGEEEIYIVREDAEDKSWVQFGDGKTGARLPTGTGNVVAVFRTGNGAYGPLQEGAKVQAGARLDRLDQVALPGLATGGEPRESGDNARRAAPGKLQSLDRLVTLSDFEAEALATSGVASAVAAWRLESGIPTLAVTVLMETGRGGEIQAVADILAKYDRSRGARRFPVKVIAGRRRYATVRALYAHDPAVRAEDVAAAIALALGVNEGKPGAEEGAGLFSLGRRRFGQPEYASRIEGTIQNVDGVLWAKVTGLSPLALTDDPAALAASGLPNAFTETAACGADEILSLYRGHLLLTPAAQGAS